eukprot:3317949-Prymnesium_polylepis.1
MASMQLVCRGFPPETTCEEVGEFVKRYLPTPSSARSSPPAMALLYRGGRHREQRDLVGRQGAADHAVVHECMGLGRARQAVLQ